MSNASGPVLEVDQQYCGLPWKAGGRDRAGVDCVGLVALWLQEQMNFELSFPPTPEPGDVAPLLPTAYQPYASARGDILFLRKRKTGQISHVAVHLGGERYLHIVQGGSRIDNGLILFRRLGFEPVGALNIKDAHDLCQALANPKLADPVYVSIALVVLSIALSLAAHFLTPGLPRQGNKYGRYGFDGLVTLNSPEVPLPDLLGQVVVPGNSPYTQLQDKSATVSTTTTQKINKIVILNSAPSQFVDFGTGLQINNTLWNSKSFKEGTNIYGLAPNPAQTVGEACDGSIAGDTYVPSFTIYQGEYDISVPVDVRSTCDRTFPIYGFSGCSYIVFRLIDSAKFPNFNQTVRVRGRKCRTFNASGFVTATETAESHTGDGVAVRFKLAYEDIVSVSALTVGGVTYTEISAANQTTNVYSLNKTKGYVEFLSAVGNAVAIAVTYSHYVREWSQNPAMQIAYLLTEVTRGKGFDASKIDWASFVTARDYCDEVISYVDGNGSYSVPRYQSNYAIDYRKPMQEHLRAILDACYSHLFLSGGKYVMAARAPGASVFSFTTANILAGSFASEQVDRSERPNRIHAFFHTEDTYNAETEVIVDDAADQRARSLRAGNNGIVEENLKFPAVTAGNQAARLAETILHEMTNSRWACEFTTNIQGIPLQPMDIVDITHPSRPAWAAKLFRVEEVSHDEKDQLALKLSEYTPGAYI